MHRRAVQSAAHSQVPSRASAPRDAETLYQSLALSDNDARVAAAQAQHLLKRLFSQQVPDFLPRPCARVSIRCHADVVGYCMPQPKAVSVSHVYSEDPHIWVHI